MRGIFLSCALALVIASVPASPASADWTRAAHSGYWLKQNGTTNDGWYYTRGSVCDSCGRCTWKYYRHHAYVAPAAAPSYAHSETVPQAVLAIAKQEHEYAFLLKSLRELGYTKGGYPGYGGQPQNAPQAGQPQAGTPANQYGHGSTYYGYSSYATHQPTPVDVMALHDRAARGRDQAQRHAAEADARLVAMTGQLANDQLTAAKAAVLRDLGSEFADKIANLQSPEIHAETVYQAEASASASAGQVEAEPDAAEPPQKQLDASIEARCVSCHSGNAPQGGFDMTQTLEFDRPTWLKVVDRVTSSDDTLRMPRAADGPGHPLPESEQMLYLRKFATAK